MLVAIDSGTSDFVHGGLGHDPLAGMSGPANGPLVLTRASSLGSFVKNQSGGIIGIVVRNPSGVDGGSLTDSNPFDGLVTLTPNDLFQYGGTVWWGRL